MTEIEDAVAREHAAAVMHLRLCEAFDRGEPAAGLAQHAHTEWVRAKDHLAMVAFSEFLGRVTA